MAAVQGAPRRAYDSPKRAVAAAATRDAILTAAQELFVRDGYGSTALAEVANRAGVALKTVYVSVGGKPQVLAAIVHRTVSRSLDDWAAVRSLRAVADGRATLAAIVGGTAAAFRATLPVILLMTEAARLDPDIAVLAGRTLERYREGLHHTAALLEANGLLAEGVDTERAFEVLVFHLAPPSWQVLRDFGWSWPAICDWLVDQLSHALLAP